MNLLIKSSILALLATSSGVYASGGIGQRTGIMAAEDIVDEHWCRHTRGASGSSSNSAGEERARQLAIRTCRSETTIRNAINTMCPNDRRPPRSRDIRSLRNRCERTVNSLIGFPGEDAQFNEASTMDIFSFLMGGWVPILAGISLCGGGLGAVLLDLLEQRREERILSEQQNRAPNTVLIRTLSYVTGNPRRSCKADVFITGCSLYAAFGGLTGILQSVVLVNSNYINVDEKGSMGVQLIVYPIIIGLSGILLLVGVRLLPYDKYPRAGIATHVIVAGLFQMFSIIYCFTAIQWASIIFGEGATITTVRKVFTYISVIGLVLSFLLGGYVMGKSAQLTEHEKAIQSEDTNTIQSEDTNTNSGTLTPKQVWSIKCWMACLSLIQMSIGISTSVVTASGAAEIDIINWL